MLINRSIEGGNHCNYESGLLWEAARGYYAGLCRDYDPAPCFSLFADIHRLKTG